MDQDCQHSLFFKASVTILLIAALHYRASYTPADADLWGHIKFGQDIKATGRIVPIEDSYSYLTAGQPWINHEWLCEFIFAVTYDSLGTPGLVLLKTVIDLIILVILYVILCRDGLDPLRAGIVIVVVAFLLFYHILTVRPQLFTYVCFLATVIILKNAEMGRDRWLFMLPPTFALWVNLHGGFLAGMALLVAWSSTHLILSCCRRPLPSSPSSRRILWALAACGLAVLINPYGYKLLELLGRTATIPRPEIGEWRSVTEAKLYFLAYFVLVLASIFSLHFSNHVKRPALIIIYLITAVLPLMAIRHLPLFAIAFVTLTGEFLGDIWNRLPGGRARGARSMERGMAMISVVGAVVLIASSLPNYTCIPIIPRLAGSFPARAVALLERSSFRGNLVCPFEWGEYLIWHLGPRIKVSIDGRRETIYSEAVYDENGRFQRGTGDWDAILRRLDTEMVMVPNGTPPFNLLTLRSDWTRVYQDALCSLFVRRGSPLKAQLEGIGRADIPADGHGLCFP